MRTSRKSIKDQWKSPIKTIPNNTPIFLQISNREQWKDKDEQWVKGIKVPCRHGSKEFFKNTQDFTREFKPGEVIPNKRILGFKIIK